MKLLEILLMSLAGVWQGVRQDWNLLEIIVVAMCWYAWKRGWRPRWRRGFPVVRKPWMAAVALALGVVGLRLALLPVLPAPVPVVTDEFSHLLLADTLLHGRVANPTHPFWQHFESLHIVQRPHYVSNYFPGHAVLLAAGRLIAGNPWAGVLAECAAFLGLLYWALRGWMPGRWAWFGVLLAALRFGIGSYWVNAFHGGFLPATGGALALGAFPRLWRRLTFGQGLVFGAGLGVLMASRPFEGAFYSLPLVCVLVWESRRQTLGLLKAAAAAALPAGAVAALLAVYFTQITGSPLVTPYQISQETYGWPMGLAWVQPKPVHNLPAELQQYYNYELSEHEKVDGPADFIEYLTLRLQEYWRFFFGPILTAPLVMFPQVWRRRRMLVAAAGGAIAAILMEGAASPHYLAPATAAIVGIAVECCRHVHARRIGWVPLLPAAMALVLALRIGAANLGLPYTQKLNYQSWCCKVEGNLNKARIAGELKKIPGKHLVLVKAKSDKYNLLQWIYNDADIDGSRIVWARDLGPKKNSALEAYFQGRRVWLVDPNVEPATCVAAGLAATSRSRGPLPTSP